MKSLHYVKLSKLYDRRIFFVIFSALMVILPLVVLNKTNTSRACQQPLIEVLIVSTIFIFFAIAFGMMFCILREIHRIVKVLFHIFAFASFIFGILTMVYSFSAHLCITSTPELYYWCLASGILSLLSTGYFIFVVPFWIIEQFRKGFIINWRKRRGICYEPMTSCACLWHVWSHQLSNYSCLYFFWTLRKKPICFLNQTCFWPFGSQVFIDFNDLGIACVYFYSKFEYLQLLLTMLTFYNNKGKISKFRI